MRELDLVLTRYLDRVYARASTAEQAAFERLLELSDPELIAYLMRRQRPTDPQLSHVVAQLASSEA
jgi:antitoxin CptB